MGPGPMALHQNHDTFRVIQIDQVRTGRHGSMHGWQPKIDMVSANAYLLGKAVGCSLARSSRAERREWTRLLNSAAGAKNMDVSYER